MEFKTKVETKPPSLLFKTPAKIAEPINLEKLSITKISKTLG